MRTKEEDKGGGAKGEEKGGMPIHLCYHVAVQQINTRTNQNQSNQNV